MDRKKCPNKAQALNLSRVAVGKEKADLAIVNADLVNVYTGELLHGWCVATKGERVAYVGPDANHTIGSQTMVIDASGKTLIPGLIDGHTHLLWYFTLDEFLKYAMRGGTTTIITETVELAFPLGSYGILDFLETTKGQPIKIFATAAPMSTISPAAEENAMDVQALRRLLKREEILGLGETYWSSVVRGDDRILSLFAETLVTGKKLEGHAAGARGNKLVSYIATGISSCHESTTAEEALERMRLGVHTMIREGDIRMELSEISQLKDKKMDSRRLVLVTDGVGPKRLIEEGYMEFILQRAIGFGFDPISAIQMATLNVAEHFGIDGFVGGIAPGKYADMVIVPNLTNMRAEYVISNGQIIAQDGKVLIPPRKVTFEHRSYRSIEFKRRLIPTDFRISVESGKTSVMARVMDLVTNLVSREAQLEFIASDGEIKVDVDRDILKIAVVTTHNHEERIFTGLVRGFGIRKGAFATSAGWDTCALTIVGADERDLAEAANRVIALKGGVVVFADGQVQAELAFPIGGVISDQPLMAIAKQLHIIQQKLRALGCPLPDAHMTLTTFTSASIPFLRLSEAGLVDVRKGEFANLII